MNLPKQHLSHSQINMFLRCPKQYEYRYLENIIAPPSGMIVLGKSGHKTLAYNFTQKIETCEDLKDSEIADYFAEEFDRAVEEEEPVFDEEDKGEIKDKGVKILKKYRNEYAKEIQPVAVEQEFNIEFENVEYTFKGFIDLITDKNQVRDHKFAKRTPNQNDINEDLQATIYYLGYKILYGTEPQGFEFDYLIAKKEPEIKLFPTTRDDEDINEYLELVGNITYAIKSGIFYKNTQGWQCSPKYCGYYGMCRPHKISKIFI